MSGLRILIFEQMNPEIPSASGIDTIIRDFVRYDPDVSFCLAGISDRRPVGEWTEVSIGAIRIPFLPIANLSKTDTRGVWQRLPHSLQMFVGMIRARKSLRMRDIDQVQIHRAEYGPMVRALLRLPYVLFIHNATKSLTGRESESVWARVPWAYRFLLRRAVRSARSIGVFNGEESVALKALSPRVERCFTWFDPDVFFPPALVKSTDRRALRVAWVGRLESQKDPALALEAVRALSAMGTSVSLEVVGSGSLQPSLAEAAAHNGLAVTLRGTLPPGAVGELFRRSDVLLMTSHFEGSPTVLVEGLASGLPVVCTAGSDPDRLISDGQNGYVTAHEAGALAAALARAAERLESFDTPKSVSHRSAPGSPTHILYRAHMGS